MTIEELLHDLFLKRNRLIPKEECRLDELLQSLGHPELNYPTIHVAGTNGKGSVSTKIAKVLQRAGYKVGLFTSPHIQNYRERIQISGHEIPDDDIQRLLVPLMERFPSYCFFDYTTLLAFQYFSEQKIDVAVIEAGIGGLFDTTNVVHPRLSIITSIGLDHTEILGSTLDEIAFQKAGIIKPGVPVVIGPKARYNPIHEQARLKNSPLIEVDAPPGDFDLENQAIARVALCELRSQFPFSEDDLAKGLLEKPPCRFERIGRFVLDVAHNVEGLEGLVKTWNHNYPKKKFNAVVGLSSDKDLAGCLEVMSQNAEHIFLVSAGTNRAATAEQLGEILSSKRISNYTTCDTIESAIARALACDQDILVCGSFYIMKQAREQIFGLQVG